MRRGDRVKVKKSLKADGVEDKFYTKSFSGQIGELFDVTYTSKGVPNFHVLFDDKKIGIFYENEIEGVEK